MVTFVSCPDTRSHIPSTRESSMKLRVMVAEDDPRLLEAIVAVLGREFEVVAAAPDGETLLRLLAEGKPDVVILDLGLPGMNGLDVARAVLSNGIATRVIICSVEKDPELVTAALQAGASCYIWKERIVGELNAAVKMAARGEQFISPI